MRKLLLINLIIKYIFIMKQYKVSRKKKSVGNFKELDNQKQNNSLNLCMKFIDKND